MMHKAALNTLKHTICVIFWLRGCRSVTLLFAISLLIVFPGHASQVYKYKDDNGVVQFDHRPPEDKQYEVVEQLQATPSSINSSSGQHPPKEDSDHVSSSENSIYDSQLDGLEAERMKACKHAKENKRILLSTVRVSVKQLDGTEKLLTKEEKIEKLKTMDQAIKDFCPDSPNNSQTIIE